MFIDDFIALMSQTTSQHAVLPGSVVILMLTLYLYRRFRRQREQQLNDIDVLRRDLRALTTAALGVGKRVTRMERQQRQLADRPEPQAPVVIHDAANQPYEQAIRMVQHGSSTDDLVNICGLSESEAELIRMMHRFDKAS